MEELVFRSIEELKDYLKTVPDHVMIRIIVDEGGEADAETDGFHAVQHE